MKTLLLVAFIATPALAGELPLNAVYGTPDACQLYAEGGTEYVLSVTPPDNDDRILVLSKGMFTWEASCSPLGSTLGAVSFSCNDGDNPYTLDATLTLKGDTLTWGVENESIDLHLCPASEFSTM